MHTDNARRGRAPRLIGCLRWHLLFFSAAFFAAAPTFFATVLAAFTGAIFTAAYFAAFFSFPAAARRSSISACTVMGRP